MGYLVQVSFKNSFKDFRLQDVMYFESLEAAKDYYAFADLDVAEARGHTWDWKPTVQPLFLMEEDAEVFAEILRDSLGVTAEVYHETNTYHYKDYENGNGGHSSGFSVDVNCIALKAWELKNGQTLENAGATYGITTHGLVPIKDLQLKANKLIKDYLISDPDVGSFRGRRLKA